MIHIEDKCKCVGCNGCASVCPTQCIELKADAEGFLYPVVDVKKCIDCGLCERVCPVLVQDNEREPIYTYAAVNKSSEVRAESSSGGVFSLLADEVISDGGVVFGAVFNDKWEVVHTEAQSSAELVPMRGSKYVQSHIGECYKLAKKYLNEGRRVLFSATQCQIAGLRRYLQKEYDNLICVDIICHGVPSPAVFKAYLSQEVKRLGFSMDNLKSVNFRDKRKGWRDYSFVCKYNTGCGVFEIPQLMWQNVYMRGFLKNIYLRPSCHACPAKSFKSGADVSIADLWGAENISPEIDDDKGVSLVCINSEKGRRCFESISDKIVIKEIPLVEAVLYNPQVYTSAIASQKRKLFFELFGTVDTMKLIHRLTKASFKSKLKRRIMIVLKKMKINN